MRKIFFILFMCFGVAYGQIYQNMPQPGYGPINRMLVNGVLTIPRTSSQQSNITGGVDTGRIRYNESDSSLQVYTGYQWRSSGGGELTTDNLREIPYIETNEFTALTGYTAVGSPTYSISGGKVVFTGAGAAGAYTKYIKNNLGVLTEQNTLQATITLDAAPDAASYGVAIGFKSYSAYCPTASVIGGIVTATGGNFGKLFIYGDYGAQLNYGPTNTDLNNGDVIRISLSNNGWKWSLLVQNFTQGWEERQDLETSDGGFIPLLGNNSANPSFFHMGGNISLDSFHYTVHAPLSTDLMIVGNSVTYGQDADYQYDRFVNLIGNTEDNIFSGGGCDVTQSIIDRLPEIISIHPKRVLLHDLAGNDIAQAISSATWQANLITIRNTIVAAGIPVIWTNGQPRIGLDESPQKTFIEGEPTFAGDLIIDTWTPMLGTGTDPYVLFMSDATHPNNIGMRVVANAVNNALGFPYVGKVLSTQIAFGSTKGVDTSSANLAFAAATNIMSIDSGGISLTGETTFAGIGQGSVSRQQTGLTLRGVAGSGLTYNFMLYDPSGNGLLANTAGNQNLVTQFNFGAGLMGVTAPTALLDAGASTTSRASLRIRDGVAPSSPNAGDVWKVTDKFYGVINTGTATKEFTLNDAALASGRVPYVTTNGRLTDVSTFTFGSGLLSVPQIKGSGSTPAIAGGAGAGTSPTVSITGTDLAGMITVTTDTDPTNAAVLCTITFATAFGTAPFIQLTPADDDAAMLSFDSGSSVTKQVHVTSTTTTFVINTNGSSAPYASTQFKWYYQVIQ